MGATIISGSIAFGANSAHALNGPSDIAIDGGPLGTLQLSGGVDGFFYGQTGTSDQSSIGDKATGANLGGMFIHLRKTDGVIQFNLLVGAYSGAPALGTKISPANITYYPTTFKIAALTFAPPSSPLTFSVGQLGSLEGYEDGFDFNNSNLFASSLWYVENSSSRGVSVSYNKGPVSATVTFGDGFDTNVYNFLQAYAGYTINPNNNINFYYAGNLSRTNLNATTYHQNTVNTWGSNYINSQMFGAYYSYTHGNLNLVPEVQYVYAKPDQQVGIKKYTANFGAVLLTNYKFGDSPYSLGGMAEYFDSVGTTKGSQNYWFVAPGAEGVGLELSPTWQHKYLFSRVSAGYMYLLNNGSPASGYGNSGHGKDVFQVALEGGLVF
jgi:hypothetical protein